MSWHQECPVGFGPGTSHTEPLEGRSATGAAVGAGGAR